MLTAQEQWVLKKARARIASGRTKFICVALTEVATRYPEASKACDRLSTFVSNSLGVQGATLACWQRQHGIIRTKRQQRLDRVKWLDWMLGRI